MPLPLAMSHSENSFLIEDDNNTACPMHKVYDRRAVHAAVLMAIQDISSHNLQCPPGLSIVAAPFTNNADDRSGVAASGDHVLRQRLPNRR